MVTKSNRGYRTTKMRLVESELTLRGSQKLMGAVETITADMTLYHGVKFAQILEAVYEQGKKDGAREAFERVESGVKAAMKAVPHKNPGRPPKKK